METDTILLITSLCVNIIMIIKEFTSRIRHSKCCFGEIDLESSSKNTPTNVANC